MLRTGYFHSRNHHVIRFARVILLISILSSLFLTYSSAQRTGEQAEMDRLENQANDLAAQNDSEGAALAIGKAAMMAKIIAQQQGQASDNSYFKAVEKFFRAQEYTYRALAIFQQTGGQPPAPYGVCQFLTQAGELLTQGNDLLKRVRELEQAREFSQQRYLSQIREWQEILYELPNNLACE